MTPEEINQKAIEYAELKHKEEADNPAFERDISESQIDFARGYTAALSKVAEKELELDEKKNCRTCNELGHPCWLHDPSNPDNKVAEMPTEEEAISRLLDEYCMTKINTDEEKKKFKISVIKFTTWFRNRIKEPKPKMLEMPTEEEAFKKKAELMDKIGLKQNILLMDIFDVLTTYDKWFRNRMTCSEKPNNHTGGGE